MKVLLDTCVIIDFLQKREPFFENAKQIFLMSAKQTFDFFITAKSLLDIYYIIHHTTHSNEAAKLAIQKIIELFSVLPTTGKDCQNALLSDISDYEDAVMVESAKENNIDCIVTRNIKDCRKSDFCVLLPEDFVQKDMQ